MKIDNIDFDIKVEMTETEYSRFYDVEISHNYMVLYMTVLIVSRSSNGWFPAKFIEDSYHYFPHPQWEVMNVIQSDAQLRNPQSLLELIEVNNMSDDDVDMCINEERQIKVYVRGDGLDYTYLICNLRGEEITSGTFGFSEGYCTNAKEIAAQGKDLRPDMLLKKIV